MLVIAVHMILTFILFDQVRAVSDNICIRLSHRSHGPFGVISSTLLDFAVFRGGSAANRNRRGGSLVLGLAE